MLSFSFHKREIHDYRISGEYHKSNNSFYIQDVFDKPPVLLSCSPYLFRSIIQCWINMCQFCLIAKMNNASKRNWSKNTPRSIKRIVLWFFFSFFHNQWDCLFILQKSWVTAAESWNQEVSFTQSYNVLHSITFLKQSESYWWSCGFILYYLWPQSSFMAPLVRRNQLMVNLQW